MAGQWSVELSGPARRGLERLPAKIAGAALEFMAGALVDEPTRVGKPLRLDRVGEYTARRGSWRTIYALDTDRHLIRILAIGPRSEVYRPR
ncbi:MAG TPA: type II toxin-antitoxin system RelE/ParE family toxin [Candidatus Dormibacteraeota bacterium]|nr:type II toxin-antitoxin system RelE/ParE family toxin [Candidatus Dormibacteraeota bacterium]